MSLDFREIHWPYETVGVVTCNACGHQDKVDATTRCYWNDETLEFRCRKCFHQWALTNATWVLAGKRFYEGEKFDGYPARTEPDGGCDRV